MIHCQKSIKLTKDELQRGAFVKTMDT